MSKLLFEAYADEDRSQSLGRWTGPMDGNAVEQAHAPSFGQKHQTGEHGSAFAAPARLTLHLVLDGTGALGPCDPVDHQLKALKKVVYNYDGDTHALPLVDVSMVHGTQRTHLVFGRLVEMSIGYTLFSPRGAPLRAKLELGFIPHTPAAQREAETSLDLPHVKGSSIDPKDTLS